MAPQTRSASRPETPAFPLGSDGEYDGAAMRERKPRKNKKTLRKKDAAATVTLPSLSNSDASDDEAPWEGRLIRLAEVAEHRTAASAWTVVNGVVCDVTPFVRAHPGGDLILVAAGIDSTPLFESYHRVGLWGFAEKRFAIGRLHPDDMPLVAPLCVFVCVWWGGRSTGSGRPLCQEWPLPQTHTDRQTHTVAAPDTSAGARPPTGSTPRSSAVSRPSSRA